MDTQEKLEGMYQTFWDKDPKKSEIEKLVLVKTELENAIKEIGAKDRFVHLPYRSKKGDMIGETEYTTNASNLPVINFSAEVDEAKKEFDKRKTSGIRAEVVVGLNIHNPDKNNQRENFLKLDSESEVFLVERPKTVERKNEAGVSYKKEVSIDEGAGKFVPHPMGAIEQSNFQFERSFQDNPTFFGVLKSALIDETGEEIGDLYPQGIRLLSPYLDRQTKVIIYPMLNLLDNGQVTHFLHYVTEYAPRYAKEPDVSGHPGFRKLSSIVLDIVKYSPEKYYPGTLQILLDLTNTAIKMHEETK